VHVKELFDLTGKVALVTGGSRGLGLSMAHAFGEAGAAVAITARRDEWLRAAEDELRAARIDCTAATCDVADPSSVDRVVADVLRRFKRIDVLVNNAGTSWGAPAADMPIDKWRQVLETNATGCFLMSQTVGRDMIRAGSGSIINITSVMGISGIPADVLDAIGYTASKGAIVSLTKDLAVKWAVHGIRVNAVAPGFFETRLTTAVLDRARDRIEGLIPMARVGAPDELKGIALFLASAASSYVTGQIIAVDGGATAW
jgi:NAD(P)-dependent dehydrogenase (short-subunit alcohol dehydrogenase family)